jgi:homogentisate 1,2-dioxygenase
MITTQNLFQHLIISNIDSDEVLYYVDGDFMSNNIEQGHITLHPKGIPMVLRRSYGHSIGTETHELDTFRPLMVTRGDGIDDGQYYKSWVE